MLSVKKLSVSFGKSVILNELSFDVFKGEAMAIIGPNGSGKSVLLRTLLGLVHHKGEIIWAPNIKIGYVPQRLDIEEEFPLTVKEFLQFKAGNYAEIIEVLEKVGIKTGETHEHHLEHHILNQRLGVLSGGEFQRVIIARALIGRPDVLLFDEPTSGVDISGEQTIYNLLFRLQKEIGLTVILVSHDLNVVYKYANNVLCLNKEQVCFGRPDVVLTPEELKSLYGGGAEFYKHSH